MLRGMVRAPLLLGRLPRQLAIGAGLLLWLWICARVLIGQIDQPGKFGLLICVAFVFFPIVVRYFGRLPVFFLAAYCALVPFNDLLVTGGGATMTKLLAILTGLALAAAIVVRRRAVPPSRSLYAVAALSLYVGMTVFWAISPDTALNSYAIFLNYAVLFVVIALYPVSEVDLKLLLTATIMGSLAAALYGLNTFWHMKQSATHFYLGDPNQYSIDPNEYAATLLMPIAVSLMLAVRARSLFVKSVLGGLLAAFFAAVLVSGSRGGIIALAAVLLFLLVRSSYAKQMTAIVVALGVGAATSPLLQRFTQADVMTADGRTEIWKVGFASLGQYWLGGAGIGNFPLAFQQYFLRVPHTPLPWDRVAHSVFLQASVEYGIVGFGLAMAVWYYMFREPVHAVGGGWMSDVALGLRAGVLGLFVAGFSLDLMMYKYTWLTFALVALTRSALISSGQWAWPSKRKKSNDSWTTASVHAH